MRVAIPSEDQSVEPRVAATPDSVKTLKAAGCDVVIQAGLGAACSIPDPLYEEAGATIAADYAGTVADASAVLRVRPPADDQIDPLPRGCLHAGFLDPFAKPDLAKRLADKGVTAVSLELMPRTTLAQKMDGLSSQHSVAGYAMVLIAAGRLGKAFPMMVTPAGTIKPARVLIVGAGVAGLQAIATAKRLGARVEAFDTRPAAAEQVESLGAKFVKIDLGETGETAGGYARELSEEQKAAQRTGLAKAVSQSDVVITTAQLFGRPAPRIIDRAMLDSAKPGSLFIDYAVSSGGNIEGSVPDEEVTVGAARVLGLSNAPGSVPRDASLVYAVNIASLVQYLRDDESGQLAVDAMIDAGDEIAKGCVVTRGGEVVHPLVREKLGMQGDPA